MFTLDTMPAHARVWIYQADRQLTAEEAQFLTEASRQFVAQWAAHGTPLTAAAEVLNNYFLVIAVDEAQAHASGCSIDKSVNFVKAVGGQFTIDFFNRLNIAVDTVGVRLIKMADIEEAIAAGNVTPDTMVYDNTVVTVDEFRSRWHTAIKNTWLSRYFKPETAQ